MRLVENGDKTKVVDSINFGGRGRVSKLLLDCLADSDLITSPTEENKTLEDFKLPEPSYGEQVVGTLTQDELGLFLEYSRVAEELDDLGREMGSASYIKIAEAIRNKSETELAKDPNSIITPEEAGRVFKLNRRVTTLHSLLFWHLGEKYECHDHTLGIRSRGRVVKGGRKW